MAMSSTSASWPQDPFADHVRLRLEFPSGGETGGKPLIGRKGIFSPAPVGRTGATPLEDGAVTLRLVPQRQTPKIAQVPNLKPDVDGVVAQYDEVSVACLLQLGGKEVRVQLPRSLFPEEIRYGTPVSIRMVEEGGIRRPQVTARVISAESARAVDAEFKAILAGLS